MDNKTIYNKAKDFQDALIKVVQDFNAITEQYYEDNRALLLKQVPEKVPKFLKCCRTLESFTSYLTNIASGSGSWKERRTHIYSEFGPLLDYLEFGGTTNFNVVNIIFNHIRRLLNDGYYFNAVEEAYKIVRGKLKSITGSEKATEAFNEQNYKKIFGHQPINEVEKDFFEGVKFLHMAIQFLRNEKSHTPAQELDKNLAMHYIVLASLAYNLINRK
jgi:uncharacterized protein (TIGR02391 family)